MFAGPKHLISWNVNGFRSVLRKGFVEFVITEHPDVICLQEIRASAHQIGDLPWAEGWERFWNPAEKAGYAGTAVFTRVAPMAVTHGIGVPQHDHEGRVLTLEFADYFLVNCYTPNAQRELTRLAYRQTWDRAYREYLAKLQVRKPVVACGDFNVAHTPLDLARPKGNERTHGFTIEERTGFSGLVEAGLIDAFREFEKEGGHYTWWSQMHNARSRNIGWRIDYWLVSAALRPRLRRCWILKDVMGSDHCPVGLELA